MERNQFGIFIGLALVIGVCLQIMKAPAKVPVKIAGFSKFEKLMDEGRPVYDPNAEEPVSHPAPPPIAPTAPVQVAINTEPVVTVGDQAAAPTDGEKKPEKPKTEEEKKKEAEEAKKKKAAEDKKKKKKKKKAADPNQLVPLPVPQDDEEEKKPSAEPEANNDAPMGPLSGYAPVAAQNLNNDPKTALEWENYLMKDADFERMSKFIKLYQSGAVKSDVFYPVIEAMMEDKRTAIRELAVLALASSPSQESFALLAELSHDDSDSTVRSQADSYLRMYTRIDNLRYLAAVLNSTDARAQYEAIRQLRLSAAQNLKAPKITQQGSTVPRTATTASVLRLYNPFVLQLQTMSSKTPDANVRSAAGQALSELQTLIASVSTATQVASIP